jgi:type 1 glutamine amidotransferase
MATRVLVIGENQFDFHQLSAKREQFRALFEDTVDLTITTDRSELAPERLADYDVLLDYLTDPPVEYVESILQFVRDGGGFVGLHCAADVSSFVEDPADDLAAFVGGRFLGHPEQSTFGVRILDRDHPVTAGVDDFSVLDEPYDVDLEDESAVHVLAEMDHPELGGTPIAWVRTEGEGRVVYCSLGHTDEAFDHESFQRLVRNGVEWVAEPRP